MNYSVSSFETLKRVDSAARERMLWIFSEFDNIVVSFSGGKDSSAMLDLAVDTAILSGYQNKLRVNYFDLEAETPDTHAFIRDTFNELSKMGVLCYWQAGNWQVRNATKKHGHGLFVAYEQGRKPLWNLDGKGMGSYDFLDRRYGAGHTITYWRDKILKNQAKHWDGKTANLIGITKFESLNRLLATTKTRKGNYDGITWTTIAQDDSLIVRCYPLYDWRSDDVITYLKNDADFVGINPYYEKMAKATGLPWSKIRTENVLHGKGLKNLALIAKLYPEFYADMESGGLIGNEWGDKHADEGLPRQKADPEVRANRWEGVI